MKIKVLKLGTVCEDRATNLEGTLTHWLCDMDKRIDYIFQPTGTNPEDGQPLTKISLELGRLKISEDLFEEVDVPIEILGTHVTDKASGFNGMAVAFIRHINGCFHVAVQPSGTLPKTNSPIRRAEFDLRQCKGPAIQELNPEERKQSQKDNPSPTGDVFAEYVPETKPIFREPI